MAVQSSVGLDNDVKYEGRDVYPSIPNEKMSKTVEETNGLNFGRVVALAADPDKVRTLRSNQANLVISTALSASNVLAGNIVINGVTTAYTETYAASSPATMALLVAEIDALTGISATLDADDLGITVVADPEYDVYFSSGAVTGGSAVTVTLSNTESGSFFGVSMFAQVEPDSSGNALYSDNETASVGRDIYVDVMSDDALAVGDSVFVRFLEESADDKKAGMLASAAGSSPVKAKAWSNASVYNGCAAGGIATIRVRV